MSKVVTLTANVNDLRELEALKKHFGIVSNAGMLRFALHESYQNNCMSRTVPAAGRKIEEEEVFDAPEA